MENKNQVIAKMLDWTAVAHSFCFGIYHIGGTRTGYCGAVAPWPGQLCLLGGSIFCLALRFEPGRDPPMNSHF